MAQSKNQIQIKVLRIGVVQDGKIVQERLIQAGEPVTVGESPKNTFVLPPTSLGKRFTLFSPVKGGAYRLHFTDNMVGKISYKDAIVPLDQVKQQGDAVRKGTEYVLPLTDGNRGKVSIDGITVLFQFVPPPPEPLQATKMDFRPKLIDDDDPVFYGFLGLFTALATVFMIYVINADPIERVSMDEIPDRFTQVVMKPEPQEPVEQPDPEYDEDALSLETKKAEKAEESEPQEPKEKAEKKEMTEAEKAAAEAKRRQEMEQKVLQESKLLMAIIGTRGESSADGKVEDLFSENDFSGQDLDAALASVSGVEVASGAKLEAKTGKGGSRGDADIGDLKGAKEGSATVGSGPATQVTGALSLGQEDAFLEEGDAGAVRKVVKKYSGQIKYCYESQLKSDPTLQGRVDVSFTVNKGRVVNASLFSNSTGNDALGKCIVGKVKLWRFPDDVQGEVVYPFILTPAS
ncbi:MAG: AgmX/PglI C-terminal domain-containing protein [Alphaproteobacteria bacterium]|nr:AgmX/PglI C-terminal domain-containing protein [Alphaproteobacteria bacterium]